MKLGARSVNHIDRAVHEQLKSRSPVGGLKEGKRGTTVTISQMIGCRRRTENILIDMIDNWSKAQRIPVVMKQTSNRRRRRGPRASRR
jgi:hypothetical protein